MDYSGHRVQEFIFNSDNLGLHFTFPIGNNDTLEPTKQFIATVTTNTIQFPGVVLDPNQAVINILNDDGAL